MKGADTMKRTFILPGENVRPGTISDMLKRNHLLIAGTTGSGKSTLIKALIHSMLLEAPCVKSLILIDPKKVDLYRYRNLPHTYCHADNIPDCILALEKAKEIISKRYDIMQSRDEVLWSGGDIYIIVDELADLMTTARKQVLPLLQSIGQIGRAAKVHLICATQCPIVKVIPTELKVNFDGIVGLRTRSAQDSRNILSETGCEFLPMYGKMIYHTPALMQNLKTDTPYYPDSDENERINFWNEQATYGFIFKKKWISNPYQVN